MSGDQRRGSVGLLMNSRRRGDASILIVTVVFACGPGPSAYDPAEPWTTGKITLASEIPVANASFLHVRLFETPIYPAEELGTPLWLHSDAVTVTQNSFPAAYKTPGGIGCVDTVHLRTVAWISNDQASEMPHDREPFGVTDFVAETCGAQDRICACGNTAVDVHIDRSSF